MRVLITGGAGFIGSALVRYLVKTRKWPVTNLDKLTYASNLASLSDVCDEPGYSFIRADICDGYAIQKALFEMKPQAIIHLAAESHVDRSINSSADFVRTNIVGTHTLLEAAHNYWNYLPREAKADFRFLHVSTDEVYGSVAAPECFTEASRYDPRSPYSATKAASDHLVRAWHETHGLPTLITNCSNNYGPYQFPEKLIPLILLNALEQKPLPVYGDGLQVRDWLYVDDHVKALTLIVERGRTGSTYNVGGRAPIENIEVVKTVCDLIDEVRPASSRRRDLITYVTDRPGHDRRYAIDPSKIEIEIGWRAEETFASGIRETVNWYLANEPWWRPLRDGVYNGNRLGLAAYIQPAHLRREGSA